MNPSVLTIAALLDYLIGDPWNWPHPVRVMGWCIDRYTAIAFSLMKKFSGKWADLAMRGIGVGLGVLLIVGSGLIAWATVRFSVAVHPVMGFAVQVVLLASCFAGRSLRNAAEDVLRPLEAGDLEAARDRLKLYVGRDTENLPEDEILRAVLETVTENATDGVTAPLFYAIVGAFLAIGSVPLAIAYKAASTLDSMVGYKEPPYTHIGWFSAKTEDVLTWLPCRLTVLTLALLSIKPLYVLKVCRRDAPQDPSPNAGWSECAYAAALGVQMGGANTYKGITKHKPILGDRHFPITSDRIRQAMGLTRASFLLWLGLAVVYLLVGDR